MEQVYLLEKTEGLKQKTKEKLRGVYPRGSKVVVKIHFGEPGNEFAFTPEDVRPVVRAMKGLGVKPFFIDTPVAYPSPRSTVEGYQKVVRERGYDELGPFVISDKGMRIETKDFEARVSKELVEAENVLVLSHVKGHACSGFGGALKNLGMGGMTKETKNKQHSLGKPKFVGECRGCGVCAPLCPAGAIEMVSGKAEINKELCWGCSICEVRCPSGVLVPEKALFDDLLVQGASALINNFPGNTYYLNFVQNLTKHCDCEEDPGPVIAENVGILFSDNPVAIDKASVDLVREKEGGKIFKKENHKDPMLQIGFASRYTGESKNYELKKA